MAISRKMTAVHEHPEDAFQYRDHTPGEVADIRKHLVKVHRNAPDWAAYVAEDLLFEGHNWSHGLDAFGVRLPS